MKADLDLDLNKKSVLDTLWNFMNVSVGKALHIGTTAGKTL